MTKKNIVIILGAGANLGELEYFGVNTDSILTNKFFENYTSLENTHPHLYSIAKAVYGIDELSMEKVWLYMMLIAKNKLREIYRVQEGASKYFKYEHESLERIFIKYDKSIRVKFYKINNEYVKHFNYNPITSIASKYYPKCFGDPNAPLTMANFELQDLLIEKFSIDYNNPPHAKTIEYSPHFLLAKAINESLKNMDVRIININFDINFELAYRKYFEKNKSKKLLKMFFCTNPILNGINYNIYEDFLSNDSFIPIIKPHAGFNIFHNSYNANFYFYREDIGFTTETFRKGDSELLLEPYLIPYFLEPDEFSKDHNNRFTTVGAYFIYQQKMFTKILNEATHLLVVGYSFPTADEHLYKENNSLKSILEKFKGKCVLIDKGSSQMGYTSESVKNAIEEIKKL